MPGGLRKSSDARLFVRDSNDPYVDPSKCNTMHRIHISIDYLNHANKPWPNSPDIVPSRRGNTV
ncbi:hypothetical protein T265_09188 [Opisthorchis viverrini]|uniref:Uncharacterized protein n=1 Tax=Opisthorchis viverrini TaxID=6198 RepID=A0A074ZB46_OPIVI|nr:hypothetical protein T265_09188 [Opisthorchis viverrini]KER22782.1 hypothetical protein T265_09188 [Opisthorchis viverrini]